MNNVIRIIVMSVLVCSLNAHADDFSITIDGEMDAWYYDLTGPENGLVFLPAACCVFDLDSPGTPNTLPRPDDNDDLSAVVWLAYDDVYMYVYTEVTDDLVLGTNGARYKNDCIELKFDPDPSLMKRGGTDNTRLGALPLYSEDADGPTAVQGASVDNLTGLGDWQPAEGVDYVRRLTDNGYVLEFRAPLDNIETGDGRSLRGNETGTFGMAINFCENDDVDRTAMLQWSAGHSDGVHGDPALHGSVTFMENNILKLEAVSAQDPNIINENADDWYLNWKVGAWAPSPPDGSIEMPQDVVLRWMMGKDAVTHDVYFGTDLNNVSNADSSNPLDVLAAQGLQTNSYTSDELLEMGRTYYWRIDEVGAAPSEVIKGDVFSFTVLNYLIVVEDFEDYNDFEPDTIWNTWSDGYGIPGNGASAGYPDPDFPGGEHYLETKIVRSGGWSMPLIYDNSEMLSEVTRALNADWTEGGVATLTLFYRGRADNAPEQMYVVVDSVVVNNDDANAALVEEWMQWDIPLETFASQGVNLSNVGSMSIGFGNKANPVTGGSGTVFFDDIRLYLPEP